MYAGALVMFVGMPLALGSWWGLLVAAAIVPVLIMRLEREESFLARNLGGYADYRNRSAWRAASKRGFARLASWAPGSLRSR